MRATKIFIDPSFWALLAVNIYSVYYYFMHPAIFTTLIWLYWCQSVMLGLFNFFDIITLSTKDAPDLITKDGKVVKGFSGKSAVGFFFLFHYGFFHFVYFIFLFTLKKSGPFDYEFFKVFLLFFLGSQIIIFIQHKIQYKKNPPSFGKLFFIPYLRIIPMHLCILLPAFLGWGNMQIFVVLKVFADIMTYILTSPYYKKEGKPFPQLQSSMKKPDFP